ncbi:MAG: Crp/Fnr family transcriptional regulator [Cyclobacteriaceae bacterium]
MDQFREFTKKYADISDRDWQKIEACFKRSVLPKNHMLLAAGNVCRHLWFAESGLLRFYVLKDGVENTKFFTIAPYCFTSQASFNSQKPAKEYIETIEESVIWETTYQENEALLRLPSWNQFARKITQEVQYFTEEILEDLQTETAENRYRKLMASQPQLISRIPLKHLASFLGVAPQSLSRIRKNIMTKE